MNFDKVLNLAGAIAALTVSIVGVFSNGKKIVDFVKEERESKTEETTATTEITPTATEEAE